MLKTGDWFKVTKLEAGYSVVFPVAGLPQEQRPELRANETVHTRMHQKDGLPFVGVVTHMAEAFGDKSLEPQREEERPVQSSEDQQRPLASGAESSPSGSDT